MSASTSLPRPSVKTLCSSCFAFTKSTVTNCWEKIDEKRKEQANFTKDPTAALKKESEMTEFGTFERQESVGGFDEFGGSGDKITEWQAGWNVTNAIQGMFLVSLPYAVLHGGYWAIVAMIGVAYICCYTGKILVECLYEVDENGLSVRVRDSYVSIAKVCFGEKAGPLIVNSAQIIELLMTCILYIVLCGDLMIGYLNIILPKACGQWPCLRLAPAAPGTFPETPIDSRSWMMLCGMILIPCSFLKNLQHVSTLSFWCTVAHFLINFIILAYCLACIGHWGFAQVAFSVDLDTFPISLGIIVFSYTSHIFLPTLEGNMKDPTQFNKMLDWSHIAAAGFKSGFGYLAFLTWQTSTMQVITNNLPTIWKSLVNVILVLKAVLSYPLPYYAASELLEKIFFRGRPFQPIYDKDGELTVPGCAFRVTIVVITILMAIGIPHFGILMGFIGNFTGTMLSFIWPCYFHLKLKGNSLKWESVAFDCFIIFIGISFGIIGIYDSGTAMVEAFQIGLPI